MHHKPTNQPQKKQQKNKKLEMGISFLASCLSCFHRRPNDMKFQVQKKTQLQQHQQ
jgi:hypothetical protein